MIPGIVAAQLLGGGVAGALPAGITIPDGAFAVVDFIAGVYYADGELRAFADMIGGNPEIFTEGLPIGIEITDDTGNHPIAGPVLLDAVDDAIAEHGGFTIYYEFEFPGPANAGPLFMFTDTPDPDLATEFMTLETYAFTDFNEIYASGSMDGSFFCDSDDEERQPGFNTMAVTLGYDSVVNTPRYFNASSLNGLDPIFVNGVNQGVDQTNANLSAYTPIGLFSFGQVEGWFWYVEPFPAVGPGLRIRRLHFFPPVAPVRLPHVSATGTILPPDEFEFDKINLLCSFDGVDSSSSATDDSNRGKTLNFIGGAQLDTDQKKFGTAALLFDGASGRVEVPNESTSATEGIDFNFRGSPFTIDLHLFMPDVSASGTHTLISMNDGVAANDSFEFIYLGGFPLMRVNIYPTAHWPGFPSFQPVNEQVINIDPGLVDNTWHHLRLTRDIDGFFRFWVDGIFKEKSLCEIFMNPTALPLGIGERLDGTQTLTGSIDELRIVNGVALSADDNNFSPPSAPYNRS